MCYMCAPSPFSLSSPFPLSRTSIISPVNCETSSSLHHHHHFECVRHEETFLLRHCVCRIFSALSPSPIISHFSRNSFPFPLDFIFFLSLSRIHVSTLTGKATKSLSKCIKFSFLLLPLPFEDFAVQ